MASSWSRHWILTALAVLASVYSIYIANTASFIAVNDDNIRAEALILASLELTAYQVIAAPAKIRSSRGQFGFYMNGAKVEVEFCSEAARVDLNKASRELLAGLFTALGSDPVDAEQYTDKSSAGGHLHPLARWTRKKLCIGPPVSHMGLAARRSPTLASSRSCSEYQLP